MGPVSAFISRLSRRNPIAFLVAAALVVALVWVTASNRDGAPVSSPVAVEDLDAATAPASGAPEEGGQTDIIPPDEGGDDQSAAAPETTSTTTPPAP